MSEREEMLASVRDYMKTDGLDASLRLGCKSAWATLHVVHVHFDSERFTKQDVFDLIHEAREMFGECENSDIYQLLKSRFPEAFQ
jgi:hypothetical protein